MNAATTPVPVELWQETISGWLSERASIWQRVIVLATTDSTQDAARRLDARIGDVIVAGRQTSGRGRLGRPWADTAEQGVAVTFVIAADRPERLAIASAVAVADAVAAAMKGTNGWQARKVSVGIKWPNDVIVDGRKLAGVLIEQVADRAFIGIGVNVRQAVWPAELQGRAVSLVELGFDADRLVVLGQLSQSLESVLRDDDEQLISQFRGRDVLTGTTCGFRIGQREVQGRVLSVDPMQGLAVLTENEGEVWLPAATTTVIKE